MRNLIIVLLAIIAIAAVWVGLIYLGSTIKAMGVIILAVLLAAIAIWLFLLTRKKTGP